MSAVPNPEYEEEFPAGWYDEEDEWAYLELIEQREEGVLTLLGRFLVVALLLPVVLGILVWLLILIF